MSLAIDRLAAPTAPGSYLWRSLWTPFTSDTNGALNQAGSVEAQSMLKLPGGVLTLNGKRSGKVHVRVTLGGKLLVDAEPIGGWTVAIRHGMKPSKLVAFGSVKTNAAGAFSKAVNLTKSQYFQVGATIGGGDIGCTASFGAAVPCVSATNGKVAVVSRVDPLLPVEARCTRRGPPAVPSALPAQALLQSPLAGQKRNCFAIDTKSFASAAARESMRNESR